MYHEQNPAAAEATGPHGCEGGRGSPRYGYVARRVKNPSRKNFPVRIGRTSCGIIAAGCSECEAVLALPVVARQNHQLVSDKL